ncbi:MAG: heavy-metal-associated domain-containing protein [Ruminococcus sp.]|nr:heavy-metal-associated domain-containing protein [Ruminococcus sp.]
MLVKKSFEMEDLDCANCARKMQEAIEKLEGVQSCEVNFMLQKLTLEYEEDNEKKLFKEVKKCIRKVEPDCTVAFD